MASTPDSDTRIRFAAAAWVAIGSIARCSARPDLTTPIVPNVSGDTVLSPGASRSSDGSFKATAAKKLARLLANHDGSTITLLEALTGSDVAVVIRARRMRAAGEAANDLRLGGNGAVLYRGVEMVADGRRVAQANAQVVLSRLPVEVAHELRWGLTPVGALLRQCRIEVFRETAVLEAPSVGDPPHIVKRRYRMFTKDLPFCEISEIFFLSTLEELWQPGH